MFRYFLHDAPSAFRFKLSGGLRGAGAHELEQCWRTALSTIGSRKFLVDVSDVTEVDADGRALLELWDRGGAEFLAKSERSRLLVESITGRALPGAVSERKAPGGRLTLRLAALSAVVGLGMLLPATVWAGAENPPSPEAVLSRYTLGVDGTNTRVDGETVVIDIDAELPKLAKKGRLRAIRRMVTLGKPEYEVLESEGDRTVRQQVITRYLSADAQANSLAASSVSVSPANYKFHFIGSIGNEPTLTYVYRITPRKKRVGLIQGELWIDAATGVAVRRAGHFVKQPSVFSRRVDIAQDTDIREGAPYRRITRLTIDTRLTGRAELTIREHPSLCAGIPVSAIMPSAPVLAVTCSGFASDGFCNYSEVAQGMPIC